MIKLFLKCSFMMVRYLPLPLPQTHLRPSLRRCLLEVILMSSQTHPFPFQLYPSHASLEKFQQKVEDNERIVISPSPSEYPVRTNELAALLSHYKLHCFIRILTPEFPEVMQNLNEWDRLARARLPSLMFPFLAHGRDGREAEIDWPIFHVQHGTRIMNFLWRPRPRSHPFHLSIFGLGGRGLAILAATRRRGPDFRPSSHFHWVDCLPSFLPTFLIDRQMQLGRQSKRLSLTPLQRAFLR